MKKEYSFYLIVILSALIGCISYFLGSESSDYFRQLYPNFSVQKSLFFAYLIIACGLAVNVWQPERIDASVLKYILLAGFFATTTLTASISGINMNTKNYEAAKISSSDELKIKALQDNLKSADESLKRLDSYQKNNIAELVRKKSQLQEQLSKAIEKAQLETPLSKIKETTSIAATLLIIAIRILLEMANLIFVHKMSELLRNQNAENCAPQIPKMYVQEIPKSPQKQLQKITNIEPKQHIAIGQDLSAIMQKLTPEQKEDCEKLEKELAKANGEKRRIALTTSGHFRGKTERLDNSLRYLSAIGKIGKRNTNGGSLSHDVYFLNDPQKTLCQTVKND